MVTSLSGIDFSKYLGINTGSGNTNKVQGQTPQINPQFGTGNFVEHLNKKFGGNEGDSFLGLTTSNRIGGVNGSSGISSVNPFGKPSEVSSPGENPKVDYGAQSTSNINNEIDNATKIQKMYQQALGQNLNIAGDTTGLGEVQNQELAQKFHIKAA